MASGIETLTEKEKDALRLILRGHDAKSSARELGLSVHTINERLRVARRKLEVTSSKEAARMLLDREGAPPESFVGIGLGGAEATPDRQFRQSRRIFAWTIGGIAMFAITLAIVLMSAQPTGADRPAEATATANPQAAELEATARAFLEMVDRKDWLGSYAATSPRFRSVNTLENWADASQQAYAPLGALIERGEASVRFLNAPPEGYQEVVFTSRFANRDEVEESVTLEKIDGSWKVVGVMVD